MAAKLDDFETGSGEHALQRLLRESDQMAEFERRMAVQVRRLDKHKPLRGQAFPAIPFAAERPAERRQQNSERTAHIQMPPELWLLAADNRRQVPGAPLLDPAALAGGALPAVA